LQVVGSIGLSVNSRLVDSLSSLFNVAELHALLKTIFFMSGPPRKAKKKDDSSILSYQEKQAASILVVESDPNHRAAMRTALKDLGFGGFSDVSSHAIGLERVQDRKFTHVVFDAKATNMPPEEFLAKVLEMEADAICIPASFEPNVDNVFDMLIMGARGFLVKPFTIETVDASINAASKGEPIADTIAHAKDRNEALVAVVMSSLDKAATLLRQSRQFETARVEIPRAMNHLRRCAELAQTFAKNGDEGLIDAIEKFCLERSKGPASRLGRLRKRLKTKDDSDADDQSPGAPASGS
jgi:DNA-binding NarL/FixJ family response regulator